MDIPIARQSAGAGVLRKGDKECSNRLIRKSSACIVGQRLVEDTALVSFAGKYGTRKEKRMTLLEEYKQKRREIDAKIKELEGDKFMRCGNARYEHRVYSSGRVDEIIAVNRPRELRGHRYSEWWGQVISAKTKEELVAKLRATIADLQQLLERLEGSE